MEFTQEMNLISKAGYSMPFDDSKYKVNIIRSYGLPESSAEEEGKEQATSETALDALNPDFHHGIDFEAPAYPLLSIAEGVVIGVGVNRKNHGPEIRIKYDKYEVAYSGLSEINAPFGAKVAPGTVVGKSGQVFHLGVTFDGEEMDPLLFIQMLTINLRAHQAEHGNAPLALSSDMEVHTAYDDHQEEIEGLLINYFGEYVNDLQQGKYQVPDQTAIGIKNLFQYGIDKNMFYQTLPSMINPLGLTEAAMPLIIKAQNMLIADFLYYMQVIQGLGLGSPLPPGSINPLDAKKKVTYL